MKLNIRMLSHACFKISIPLVIPTPVDFFVIPSSRLALGGGFPSYLKFNAGPKISNMNNVLMH